MKPKGETCRTAFPAAVRPIMLGISGVVLCAGCATDTTVGFIRGGGSGANELADLEPGAVAVAMAPAPALSRFDPAEGRLDTRGRRAAESTASVLNMPPMGDPLIQTAVSPLTVIAAPFIATYDAIAGPGKLPPHKYSETEAELSRSMASMSTQDHLRKWFLASAGEQTRLTVVPVESVEDPKVKSPVSAIVETRVEELRLERKGKDEASYALTIKARARVLRASDGAVLYDQPYEYESKQALFLDWARGDGLASVAQTGFRALADQMVESTLCAPAEQAQFTGVGYRKQAARNRAPAGTAMTYFVKTGPPASQGVPSARVYRVSDDSMAIYSSRSQPGLAIPEPLSPEEAGTQAIANTEHFLDGMQDFPNPVVQVCACAVAIPLGIWNQGVAVRHTVSHERLTAASARLRKAALETRPDVELANQVATNLGPQRSKPMLFASGSSSDHQLLGPQTHATMVRSVAASTEERVPETALEIHVRKAGLTGGDGVNPKLALEVELQVRLFRTSDGKDICSYPVNYRSGSRHFTAWAADDAKVFREECARCYAEVSKSITHHLVSQGMVAPDPRSAPILVKQ